MTKIQEINLIASHLRTYKRYLDNDYKEAQKALDLPWKMALNDLILKVCVIDAKMFVSYWKSHRL